MEKWTENLDKTLKGFDGKKLDKLIERKYGETLIIQNKVYRTIRQEFGKVKRWNNYIKKFDKKIKHYTKLKNKYEVLLEGEESRYQTMLKLLNPKVTLKRPTPSFQYWRGKVWWGVGFYKKSGWKEFHIISEKKRLKQGLDEDGVRNLGKEKFVDMIIKSDLKF